VVIQASSGAGWSTVATAPADRRGTFAARWQSHRSGRFTLRAVIGGARGAARARSSAPTRVTVYPSAFATWYGPRSTGVWRTACGTQLTSTTLGVAHRTLPCGTRVELFYGGRTLVVPVIDRGPYSNGVDWDLTVGASDALGFTGAGVDRIGALPLR
jgi:rare lipoprotein A (peptidoglycan hydrolase)